MKLGEGLQKRMAELAAQQKQLVPRLTAIAKGAQEQSGRLGVLLVRVSVEVNLGQNRGQIICQRMG